MYEWIYKAFLAVMPNHRRSKCSALK